MSLRFHTQCTLGNTVKTAHFLFSLSLTTHVNHSAYHDINFISSSEQNLNHKKGISSSLNLDLLVQLQHNGSIYCPYVLNKLIPSCASSGALYMGMQIHSIVTKLGFHSNLYINTALVDMYGKCGVISYAQKLFDEMPQRNVITWNSLISGYLYTQDPEIAFELFIDMLKLGLAPSPFSVSSVLVGCAEFEAAELGAQVHALSAKSGFLFDVVVGTALIDMYWKCFDVDYSRRIFDLMPDKNVVTWTSLITGYAQNQQSDEAMHLMREMCVLGLKANSLTYNSLLSSFCCPGDMIHCKQIHCHIIREGLDSSPFLAVTLVTVYSNCGSSLEDFYKICSIVPIWDQLSWNAVIAGFCSLGSGEEALTCFSNMRHAGVNINVFTFTSILKAIGVLSALEEGRQTHALVFKSAYNSNLCVQNGLVSMYAKCGKIDEAKRVFSSMVEHDTISWNSLLSGYAHHGYGSEAVEMFEEMKNTMVKPDLTTFLVVLSACSHVGWLEKGLKYFYLMRNDGSFHPPKVEHYACIVDLYGRAGYLDEAEAFVNNMPIEPGPSVFKSLLSACRVHGNKEIALRAARKLVELCPDDPATYVLLSNVLASEGYWDESLGVRNLMCDRGVKRKPGYSWI